MREQSTIFCAHLLCNQLQLRYSHDKRLKALADVCNEIDSNDSIQPKFS